MTPAILVDGVSKSFRIPVDRSSTLKYRLTHLRSSSRHRTLEALRDVSFEVPGGQFIGITGRNGSGKSTLLKVLSRIYPADTGRVVIDGDVSPFLELGVGFNPELTARENVFLNGAMIGVTRSALRQRLDEIIGFAELETFVDQKLKNFSSGMQVRLAFAVAIQADAAVLLMDEVLAVGDARFQEKCFDVFARYKREGRTVVLVSHDLAAIEQHCDRCLLLDHGRLVADGLSAEVVGRYRRMNAAAVEAAEEQAAGLGDAQRWGSGEMRVTGIRLCDGEGHERRGLSTAEPAVIEVDWTATRPVDRWSCAIVLRRDDGLLIDEHALGDAGIVPGPVAAGDSGRVRYVVPALPVLKGVYTVTVVLLDAHSDHHFDGIDRALRFRVTDDRGRQGLVDLRGRWVVDPPPPGHSA